MITLKQLCIILKAKHLNNQVLKYKNLTWSPSLKSLEKIPCTDIKEGKGNKNIKKRDGRRRNFHGNLALTIWTSLKKNCSYEFLRFAFMAFFDQLNLLLTLLVKSFANYWGKNVLHFYQYELLNFFSIGAFICWG